MAISPATSFALTSAQVELVTEAFSFQLDGEEERERGGEREREGERAGEAPSDEYSQCSSLSTALDLLEELACGKRGLKLDEVVRLHRRETTQAAGEKR